MSPATLSRPTGASLGTKLLSATGRWVARRTGDPVLGQFVEMTGQWIPLSALGTLITWKVAMAMGTGLSRVGFLRRLFMGRLPLFHCLNRRLDEAAESMALRPIRSEAEARMWCAVLGIDSDADLSKPLAAYRTPNELFTHAPGPGTRPVASPNDDSVICAPCDGSYAFFDSTEHLASFVVKQSHFDLSRLLGDAPEELTSSFVGGPAAYLWLSLRDNHRWYAPISGRVRFVERRAAQQSGMMGLFLEDGYLEANSRAILIIEGETGKRVAFIPVGLSPINSVTPMVRAGELVCKGAPLGTFEVGGSAGVLLFDRRTPVSFDAPPQQFRTTEDLLNLNYVPEANKARRQLGQSIGEWRRESPGVENHV